MSTTAPPPTAPCSCACNCGVEPAADHAPMAESALLGALLLCPQYLDSIAQLLEADDFYAPGHTLVYRALLQLHSEGCPIDTVTVREHLAAHRLLTAAGGDDFLLGLTDAVPVFQHMQAYARVILERAARRRLRAICVAVLRDDNRTIAELLNESGVAIKSLTRRLVESEPHRFTRRGDSSS